MHTETERLETVRLPFIDISVVLWRDRDMVGLANIQIKPRIFPIVL